MEESDAELVEQVRTGNREAAGKLAEKYLRGCRAVALAIVGDPAGAEDVCQDAMVYAFARINECRNPAHFGAWLRQITRNRARNHRRDRKDARHVGLDDAEPADQRPAPDARAEQADVRRRLLAALQTLPEDRREIVLLHDLEGWTHRAVAELLGLPEGTVRSHLHYARKSLRALLSMVRDD